MPKKLTSEIFINRANIIHNSKYDYDDIDYLGYEIPVKIFCKKHNILFLQKPHGHLSGETGCAQCSQEKKKQSYLNHYGVDHPMQLSNFKEKIKQTNLKNLGVENPFTSNNIKEKIKQTNLKNYGVDNPLQSITIKEKVKQTNLERYGIVHNSQIYILPESLKLLNDVEYLKSAHHIKKKTLQHIGNDLNVDPTTVANYFRKNNIEIKYFQSSTNEKEILNYVASLLSDIKIITNTRKIIPPYELDIFIPEHNIAIEYNGLYWHSELAGKSQDYHLNKTKLCEEKGIRLIHIFEDEWRDQQQKCKDTLKHLLGKSEKGTYARNTEIKEISWKLAKDFLNKYHLLNSGTCGNYRIGAFDKTGNLIGVMVFGIKNNEGSDKSIELKRFVTDKKNNPGLGSKMFKYAVTQRKYNEVIAFVDRRWFTGLVKQFIGFVVIHKTPTALWWTNGTDRVHRRFKTKKQLIKEGQNPNFTKRQMMQDIGFYKIWDSGKLRLLWTNK